MPGINNRKSLILLLLLLPVFGCSFIHRGWPDPKEAYVNAAFRDDFDAVPVASADWQVAAWVEHGGQTGPERCYASGGLLNMVFRNDSALGFLSSAIQTQKEYYYGRWEARLKPSSVPGVLNSMYTIDWDDTSAADSASDGTRQEIDIEFLTCTFGPGTGTVHFAVHEDGKTSFNTNPDITLDFNPSDDFHVWGFEITPAQIQWFVDGEILCTYVYEGNPIAINAAYQLKLNAWSAVNWINGPPVADTDCLYRIDWIRFTPLPR
jgi:endo-1,3-1,4-beta-glycanase ExoK